MALTRTDPGAAAVTVTPRPHAVDLTSLLQPSPVERGKIYAEAMQLLAAMRSSPSCHQRAATDLISSCRILEGKPEDHGRESSLRLDQFKSLYAARLAVCELNGAGAAIPDCCTSILNSEEVDRGQQSFHTFERSSPQQQQAVRSQLETCLRALESRPQWWTSYSNNRQNAAVMCQAARFDIERDELLNHHRKLAEITFGLTASLNQSLADAVNEAAYQRAFLDTINESRLKMIHDMQDAEVFARNQFAAFVKDIETQIHRTGKAASQSMNALIYDTEALSKVRIPHLV